MKRKKLWIILCILSMAGIFYLQFSRNATVCNYITTGTSGDYEASMTVTMHKLVIFNQAKTEENLINRIVNNDFKNMQFSYDVMGYPNEVTVTVYANNLTKKLGIPAFCFRYAPLS